MALMDVVYRVGQNGVTPDSWPNLFQAIHDNNIPEMLKQTRTRFTTKSGRLGYDNARVKRLGEYLYPGMFEYDYLNNHNPKIAVRKISGK